MFQVIQALLIYWAHILNFFTFSTNTLSNTEYVGIILVEFSALRSNLALWFGLLVIKIQPSSFNYSAFRIRPNRPLSYSVLQFSIYSVFWIWSNEPARLKTFVYVCYTKRQYYFTRRASIK